MDFSFWFGTMNLDSPLYISRGVWLVSKNIVGAQWLSGRLLDSRPKGRGFKPHRCHCVVVLEKDTFVLA